MSRELVTWHAAGVLIACGVKLQQIADYAMLHSAETINRHRFAEELGQVIGYLERIHKEYTSPADEPLRFVNPGEPA